jgi:hypothetical protein
MTFVTNNALPSEVIHVTQTGALVRPFGSTIRKINEGSDDEYNLQKVHDLIKQKFFALKLSHCLIKAGSSVWT